MSDRSPQQHSRSSHKRRRQAFSIASFVIIAAIGSAFGLTFWLHSAKESGVSPLAYLRHPIQQDKRYNVNAAIGSELSALWFHPNSEDSDDLLLASSVRIAPNDSLIPSPIDEHSERVSAPLEIFGLRSTTFTDSKLKATDFLATDSWQSSFVTLGESIETGKATAHVWTYLHTDPPEITDYVVSLMRTFELPPMTEIQIEMAPNAERFALTGQTPTTAKIWIADVRTRGIELAKPSEFQHEIAVESVPTAITFSPNGKTLATAHANDTAYLWNIETGEKIRQLHYEVPSPPRSNWKGKIVFSEDGSLIAMVDASAIYLWKADSGKLINTMTLTNETGTNIWGHTRSLAISPNNQWVASDASHTNKIYFWEIASGEKLRVLRSPTTDFLTFNADSTKLATGDQSGRITTWKLPPQLQ